MTDLYQFVHCCTKNDPDGNPQRIYVTFNKYGNPIAGWNEGSEGHHCGPKNLSEHFFSAPRIDVTLDQYKKFLTLASPTQFNC